MKKYELDNSRKKKDRNLKKQGDKKSYMKMERCEAKIKTDYEKEN